LAILGPAAVLVAITSCFLCRRYPPRCCRSKRSRVHVAPPSRPGGTAVWDFTEAGPLSTIDIEKADDALEDAESAETVPGKVVRQPQRRCILLGPGNELKQAQLKRLGQLLSRHSLVSLTLHADWRRADDATLLALAALLQWRGRCRLEAVPSDDLSPLRLPSSASTAAVGAVSEAVSAAAHAEVDALTFERPESPKGSAPAAVVRLSPQRLGDVGCAAACAFVRTWAGRLVVAKLLDCELGDEGAAEVAQLLKGRQGANAASALRELSLSANRIGNRGAKELAEALPTCDSLERLLLDRNRIGPAGAKALAGRLPRSNVRELVLGSHLGGNPLGFAGVEALAEALDDRLPRAAADRPARLGALNLEDCGVGERGAKALAAALPKSELYALSVARGNLGNPGAVTLLAALPPSLYSLDLAGNGVSDVAAAAANEALRRMPQLAVSLAQNHLSPTLRAMLAEEHGVRLRV